MHELGDLDDLPVARAHLLAHPRKARGADLELGDADRVLIGHAERELARRLGEKPARAVAMAALRVGDRLQAQEIVLRVVEVLIIGEAFEPGANHRARRGREGGSRLAR